MPSTRTRPRFEPGQRIRAPRSGRSQSVAEVLQVIATDDHELYRVRWREGFETFFVPGPEVCDRRAGGERRSGVDRRQEDVPWVAVSGHDRRHGGDRRHGERRVVVPF